MVPITVPLALGGWEGLVFGFVLSVVVIALGTYLGVSLALQSFFGAESWAAATRDES